MQTGRPVITPESMHPTNQVTLSGAELGIDPNLHITAERLAPVDNIEAAQAVYDTYGAVVLSGEVRLPSGETTVGDICDPLRQQIVDSWQAGSLDPWLRQKNYDAYNGTGRHMWTIAYDRVVNNLPEVMDAQQQLMPLVQAINHDPTTQLSVDPDEGTVLNWQLFDKAETSIQQHGAHSDRVDTTVVVPLANVGPHGEIVFLHGFTEAATSMGMDPHRNFNTNLARILTTKPETIRAIVLNVQPGNMLLLHTDQDIHLITAKKVEDVKAGLADGANAVEHAGLTLGRGIINMAFETEDCRRIDQIAHEIEKRFDLHSAQTHDEFFKRMDEVLDGLKNLPPETLIRVRGAIVTRLSAADLYGAKTT